MTQGEHQYDLRAIWDLLEQSFTPNDLRRLFQTTSNLELQRLHARLSPESRLDELVEEVITYCQKRGLLPDLLREVEQERPRPYADFKARIHSSEPPEESAEVPLDGPHSPASEQGAGIERVDSQGDTYEEGPVATMPKGERRDSLKAIWLLLLNLFLAAIAGLVVVFVLGSKIAEWLPCRSPWAIGFGLSVTALSLVHVIWRLVRPSPPEVKRRIKVNLVLIEFEPDVASWLDTLHPWTLPDWGLVLGLGLAVAASVLLVLLLPYSGESMPMVENYTVHYVSSSKTIDLALDEATEEGIQLQPGQSVVITIKMVDDVDVHCTWHAEFGGRMIPEQNCKARYTAPYNVTDGVISILIESRCRIYETWANIHVKAGQP